MFCYKVVVKMYENFRGIPYDVHSELKDREISLNYDPTTSTYTPWWNVPLKVEYPEKGLTGNTFFHTKKIRIPKNVFKTAERKAGCLIHETSHADLFPLEVLLGPAIAYGIISAEDPFRAAMAMGAVGLAYLLIGREILVDAYSIMKCGFRNCRELDVW
jgi:hypothetical protein